MDVTSFRVSITSAFQHVLSIVLSDRSAKSRARKFSAKGTECALVDSNCGTNERTEGDGESATVYTKCLRVVELIREDINWRKVIISAGSSCSVV